MQVKFGVQVPQEGLTYDEIKRYFVRLEKLGFNSAFVFDHFHPIWKPEDAMVFENWILLSALAKETEKIRIGTLVNCNSYRCPSLTAKMAACLDNISNGRLEFMIGAGWYEGEYKGYGIPYPPAKVRIEQLKESIQVIKLMWTEHKAFFKGKYYSLDGAICYPKPLQKPYPRIWVGGGGEKFIMRTIAEVGEGTNFFGPPEALERKLGILRNYCEKTGRDYNTIEKSWAGDLFIGAGDHEKMEDGSLKGTPTQIIRRIKEYLKLGVNYFILLASSRSHPDLITLDQMEFFAEKVIKAFV
jgi:F420-dependent oxidoreductase-like protein